MPNRSLRDERQKVGPADPATVRQKLKERLAEREPAGLYAAQPAAKPGPSPTKDLSVAGAVRNIKARKSKIDEASDY